MDDNVIGCSVSPITLSLYEKVYAVAIKRRIDYKVVSREVHLYYNGELVRSDTEASVSYIRMLKISFEVTTRDSTVVKISDIVVPVSVKTLAEFKALVEGEVTYDSLRIYLDHGNWRDYQFEVDVLYINITFDVIMDDRYISLEKSLKEVNHAKNTLELSLETFIIKNDEQKTEFDEKCNRYNAALQKLREERNKLLLANGNLQIENSDLERLKLQRKQLQEEIVRLEIDRTVDGTSYEDVIKKLKGRIEELQAEKEIFEAEKNQQVRLLQRDNRNLRIENLALEKKNVPKSIGYFEKLRRKLSCCGNDSTSIQIGSRVNNLVSTPNPSSLLQFKDLAQNCRVKFENTNSLPFGNCFDNSVNPDLFKENATGVEMQGFATRDHYFVNSDSKDFATGVDFQGCTTRVDNLDSKFDSPFGSFINTFADDAHNLDSKVYSAYEFDGIISDDD